jgi:hypothetical protein
MIQPYDPEVKIKAVGFTEALKIPVNTQKLLSNLLQKLLQPLININFIEHFTIQGVVEFSLCLFFAKLVSYTFLYWLPRYIKNSSKLSNITEIVIQQTIWEKVINYCCSFCLKHHSQLLKVETYQPFLMSVE